MILSKKEVLGLIKRKIMQIEPFNKDNLGPASYDITLDNRFRLFKFRFSPVALDENTNYRDYTKLKIRDSIVLKPGEYALGLTKEKITLPGNIAGWIGGRTRFARMGLLIHITAAFIQPGCSNVQVLELRNVGIVPLKLQAGTKIGQIMFEKCSSDAKYTGKFVKQSANDF